MSNSTRKMRVTVTNKMPWDKKWVKVDMIDWKSQDVKASWVPSFEDLHRIIQAIAYCEDQKYPPEKGYEGRGFVARFLKDAVFETDYGKLAERYKLPIRCGSNVINDNGASLDRPL